ncbi:ABC transporter ATP-binding protein [Microaerobacter geothermalis]|uniref:ABC transporter ATP-binding protein n=1 Tax=Microaerobacter geothermalis TaxID=674972 RepID=UPI001F381B5F|nr:ABC transporter ATP-binding protein [Microaerobacter geothermalis]MCF6094631.1 ABC transporter ATP-binding protein [Microaerobacter geothermalis]
MSQSIIELKDLTKKYGEHTAVDHLSLTVNRGEIFGLLGPNGAGKSTTILMMLGLTEPTSGTVRVCQMDSTRQPLLVKKKVGYLSDDVGFYEELTGMENLIFTAQLNQLPLKVAKERAETLLKRVGLEDAASKKTGTYSRGMRQRLGLADVLIKQPEVIILDEPTLGIDPEGVRDFLELIQRLSRDDGITVLLSSHHLHQVQQICDRVGLFVSGRLLAVGDIHTLSMTLFSQEPICIEVKVTSPSEYLLQKLKETDGVLKIDSDGQWLRIGCSRDISSIIARTIVECGASLHHLTQKQYGLDEIYHRYFEGRD